MPPGKGRLEVRASVPEEYHRYLQKEAAYRKVTLPTLVLSAIDRYLHPDQVERSVLRDELDAVSKQLATLKPQLQSLQALAERHASFSRDVAQWRTHMSAIAQAHQDLMAHQQWMARRLTIGFSIVLGMLVILGALVVHPWF